MSADPRLVSTRTTWYRGASTVTVFFSYLPLTASPAPDARAPETPARAPETRAPKTRRRATWPCRPPENGRPARHPAARRHRTPTPRTLRSLEPYSAWSCRKFTRLNVRRMSHSPGIVNQTPRSIRSIHGHNFYFLFRET